MIPLRDSTRSRSKPYVTIAIIIINLYIFFIQSLSSQAQLQGIITNYALVPAWFTEQFQELSWAGLFYPPLVTSTFLHGSWFHVLSNMLYLWIFGDNVEDRLGHIRFIFFYLLAGIAGNLAHIFFFANSTVPLVGASGAIAGILGAYFITFPKARITSLIFILFFITIYDIPAFYFLLFWFVLQVVNGIASSGSMGDAVAWWAHIGGFVMGIILMPLLKKKIKQRFY